MNVSPPSDEKPLVLLLAQNVIPYRLPVFRHLARQENFRFHVCYLARKEGIRKWNVSQEERPFAHSFLRGLHFYVSSMDWGFHLTIGLLWKFIRLRPKIVVCTAWDCPAYYFAVLYGRLFGCKLVLWTGTFKYRELSRKSLVWSIKAAYIRRFDAYLSYGISAADYLVEHGAKREKIAVGYNTVDLDFYLKQAEQARSDGSAEALRREYPEKIILYVGRFIPVKGVDLLLDALSKMKEQEWACLLIGWGPEEEKLRSHTAKLNLNNKVHFLGHKKAEELAKYYLLARVLALPARCETWGLVVNEAMACGCPCVVSQGAGCARDIVEEGITGFSYPLEDTSRLAEILDRLIAEDDLYETLCRRGKEKILEFTPERYAENLMHAMFDLTDSK